MRTLGKTLKPACKFLIVLLLLMSFFQQYASAAMIGTESLLNPDRNLETRDRLHLLMARENIQKALVAMGVSPDEAGERIDSLTDAEVELVAAKIEELPRGGDATGFVVICVAIILIVLIVVEYNSDVKMFPQFQFGD